MSEPRAIYQIDPKTNNIINAYYCAKDAQESLGIDMNNISACCNGRRRTAGGFKWEFVENPIPYKENPLQKYLNPNAKAVVCYNRYTGAYISQYNSIQEAAKDMSPSGYSDSISKCCKGTLNTAFGYKWRYLGDPAPAPVMDEIRRTRTDVAFREVVKFDKKTHEPIRVYPSIVIAKTFTPRTSVRSIEKVCLKEQQTAGGYKFMFKDEYEKTFDHPLPPEIFIKRPDFSGVKR